MTRAELIEKIANYLDDAYAYGGETPREAALFVIPTIEAAGFRIVPLKLIVEAHACMRATGWQLAPASEQVSDDGVLEYAVAEIEEQFAAMVAASPIAAKEEE